MALRSHKKVKREKKSRMTIEQVVDFVSDEDKEDVPPTSSTDDDSLFEIVTKMPPRNNSRLSARKPSAALISDSKKTTVTPIVLKKPRNKPSTVTETRKSTRTLKVKVNKTTVTPIVIKMPNDKTPYIRARETPLKLPKTNYEKARQLLHVSSVPDSLPCRETEFQEIYNFVDGKIRTGSGGCMYVSGVPGTGKTATVREVMASLRQAVDDGDICDFKYIEINGMRLTEPRQAYVQLLRQLTNEKATADHAATLLTKLFTQRRKNTIVLLADELDLLWTRKQDVLYHLFDWPTYHHARLIVVAIANTMDLPERILMNRVASRLGLTRLTFKPYNFKQLQEIVATRLQGLRVFDADAIQLVSRKVAAVSGDARRCLDICRRATEIAMSQSAKLVEIEHVHAALQEMFATPMIQAMRNCSKHEQIFLQAIVAEFRHSGLEEVTLGRVVDQHCAICQLEGITAVSVSLIVKICYRLANTRLILLEEGRKDLLARIRLNVSVDDVLFALK